MRGELANGESMPEPTEIQPGPPCPICGKPSTRATRPFCSKRCADVDLHRWLSGAYVVPGNPEEDEDEQPLTPRPTEDS
jgi:endogenous inhibitor of DNA gyrase (YacG/DUF329 family)